MTNNMQPNDPAASKLPQVIGNVAIYARAAGKQRQTCTAQMHDLLALAQKLGFTEDQIIVFDQKTADQAIHVLSSNVKE